MPFFRKRPAASAANAAPYPDAPPPRHIAIIMDGNGRWAKARGLPRSAGHRAGAEVFRTIATYCRDIGLEYLTVYAFSTENWKRPVEEVGVIMELLEKYLREAIERMERDRVRMKFFGDVSALSPGLLELIRETAAISERLEGCQVNVCVNYGSRDEILRAASLWAEDFKRGLAGPLTEEVFEGYLYSAGIPDPDLIIRPSGEQRLSNFLMWQGAYSELHFVDKPWPEFKTADIDAAIAEYKRRQRRFGGIS